MGGVTYPFIVGIVVACCVVAAIAIMVAIIVYCCIRRHKRHTEKQVVRSQSLQYVHPISVVVDNDHVPPAYDNRGYINNMSPESPRSVISLHNYTPQLVSNGYVAPASVPLRLGTTDARSERSVYTIKQGTLIKNKKPRRTRSYERPRDRLYTTSSHTNSAAMDASRLRTGTLVRPVYTNGTARSRQGSSLDKSSQIIALEPMKKVYVVENGYGSASMLGTTSPYSLSVPPSPITRRKIVSDTNVSVDDPDGVYLRWTPTMRNKSLHRNVTESVSSSRRGSPSVNRKELGQRKFLYTINGELKPI